LASAAGRVGIWRKNNQMKINWQTRQAPWRAVAARARRPVRTLYGYRTGEAAPRGTIYRITHGGVSEFLQCTQPLEAGAHLTSDGDCRGVGVVRLWWHDGEGRFFPEPIGED